MEKLVQRTATATEQPAATRDLQAVGTPDPTVALIPTYNEERFIGSLVLTARQYVDYVVVVDDGSSDQTADIAQRAGAHVVQHHTNQGKAAAVNSGFAYLRPAPPQQRREKSVSIIVSFPTFRRINGTANAPSAAGSGSSMPRFTRTAFVPSAPLPGLISSKRYSSGLGAEMLFLRSPLSLFCTR